MPSIRPTLRTVSLLLRRSHSTSSVSASEVSHFSALANSWWDPMGPSRVLHLMNPLRHDFLASCLAESDANPLPNASTAAGVSTPDTAKNNLNYLDIGCGGGIFAESLARTIPLEDCATATPTRAASITAIDPTTTLIQIAREHAQTDPKVSAHLRSGKFRYVNCTLEDVVGGSLSTSTPNEIKRPGEPDKFDMITLFEVLEHIDATSKTSTPLTFLTDCLRLVKPGGWLVGSTIARTFPSFLVNQVIAEAPWPIGVVPRGTHEWSKFVNPDELEAWAQEGLMRVHDLEKGNVTKAGSDALRGMRWKCSGVVYFPGLGWKIVPGSENWGNYFWAVRKGGGM
ncbi:hypothetical protein ARAM_007091 [Aspergillus rambellii]|uniref:Ubiquinone biosynthesis O-methyltransferase, mitochondrial n=1 Tax=Aspergillus rambellii TaxID=308745 RepID=A0A0F8UFH1_9EURO|nr:hypothetical protein ARAM_007091 [Aspergillus rambellii]